MGCMGSFRYLMAVDPSLTCSGWALFCVSSGQVSNVGKIRGAGAAVPLAQRLERIQLHIQELVERFGLGAEDLLVCEAPTTIRDPHNALKVEQVRGIFESVARSRGVRVPGRVNPRTVQYEVMGLRGRQLDRESVKTAAIRTVQYLYATDLKELGLEHSAEQLARHQDIVDAVLIGRLALMKIQSARAGQVTIESLFDVRQAQRRGGWRVRSCGVS